MNCPKCKLALSEYKASDVVIHRCKECKGVWVPAKALNQLLGMEGIQTQTSQILQDIGSAPKTDLACSECANENLHLLTISDFEIDACGNCHGIFFDAGELAKIVPNKYNDDNDHDWRDQDSKLDLIYYISHIFPWN